MACFAKLRVIHKFVFIFKNSFRFRFVNTPGIAYLQIETNLPSAAPINFLQKIPNIGYCTVNCKYSNLQNILISSVLFSNGNLFFSVEDKSLGRELWSCGAATAAISTIALANSISIYPNPSNGIFQLTIDNMPSAKGELVIYNILGEKVYPQIRK